MRTNSWNNSTLIVFHEGIFVLVIFTFAKILQCCPVGSDLEILKSNEGTLALLRDDGMYQVLKSNMKGMSFDNHETDIPWILSHVEFVSYLDAAISSAAPPSSVQEGACCATQLAPSGRGLMKIISLELKG